MEIIINIIYVLLFLLTLVTLVTFAWGGVLAAPWVPLWKKDVRRMMQMAQVKPGDTVYDLGCGDGRMLKIAASEFGARAVGYEVAILPYLIAYTTITFKGLRSKIKLNYANFFHQDLGDADVICCFLTPEAMKKLKNKFEHGLKPGCRIVSYAFALPGVEPTAISKPTENVATIYLYQK